MGQLCFSYNCLKLHVSRKEKIMEKQSLKNKITTILLLFTLCLSLFQHPLTAQAASVRGADVNKAGNGNLLVGVPGSYERVSKTKILKRINEIRKEACTKGYINPATGRKLKPSDYVPMEWSSNLEWIAQLRAAESTINESHTRPNGKSCFSIKRKNEQSWAENLAWNYSGLMHGIEQWYDEKNDWVNQNTNAVTGHYTSMINPNYQYVGLGSFLRSTGGWYGISAEFSSSNTGSKAQSKLKGETTQAVEVSKKYAQKAALDAPSSIKLKKKKNLAVTCKVSFPGIMGGQNTTSGRIVNGITWSSSKPSVLSVSPSGKITAKKTGKAVITAKVKGWKTLKKTITVKK